jgi:hypothetical protein
MMIDRRLVEQAHLVPFGNRRHTVLFSDRIDAAGCTVWHRSTGLDLTQLCMR